MSLPKLFHVLPFTHSNKGLKVKTGMGFSLVEVMVATGLLTGLAVFVAELLNVQGKGILAQRTVSSRDNLRNLLDHSIGNAKAIRATAKFPGNATFPKNLKQVFDYCVTHDDSTYPVNGCKPSGTYMGITLTDALGNVIAGPKGGNPAVFSETGVLCAGPASPTCPLIAFAEFSPDCGGTLTQCDWAKFVTINYTLEQAPGVTLRAGPPLHPLAGTATSSIPLRVTIGAGVIDFLAKWTSTTNLDASAVYEDPLTKNLRIGDVGLPPVPLTHQLTVNSTGKFGPSGANTALKIVGDVSPSLEILKTPAAAISDSLAVLAGITRAQDWAYNSAPKDAVLESPHGRILLATGYDGTNTPARMTVLGNGNVGLGTMNPTRALDIFHVSTSVADTQVLSLTNTHLTNAGIALSDAGTTNPVGIFSNNNNLTFWTDLVQKMVISQTGNVGIGLTNPTEKLDVLGNTKISGTLNVGGASYPGYGLQVAGKGASLGTVSGDGDNTLTTKRWVEDLVGRGVTDPACPPSWQVHGWETNVTSLNYGKPYCAPNGVLLDTSGNCQAGHYLAGQYADGTKVCIAWSTIGGCSGVGEYVKGVAVDGNKVCGQAITANPCSGAGQYIKSIADDGTSVCGQVITANPCSGAGQYLKSIADDGTSVCGQVITANSCGVGQYLKSIADDGTSVCGQVITAQSCGAGQFLQTVASDGTFTCGSLASAFVVLFGNTTIVTDYSTGAGTRSVTCPSPRIRIACLPYSNPGSDGKTHLMQNHVTYFGYDTCGLSSPESSDPWGVAAVCALPP